MKRNNMLIMTAYIVFYTLVQATAQLPTDGFVQYKDTFYVQKPYDLPVSARFSDTGGMYTCWIYPGDKPFNQTTGTGPRTEMRWDTWKDQKLEHMWDADVMYEVGTNHTCIMQIKSNSSGEAMYIQVHTNGDLRNSVNTPFLRAYWGKWFNLKCSYDPATRKGRAWIDNVLKVTGGGSNVNDWYFKNGAYCNGMTSGSVSTVHFKNMKMWIRGTSPISITFLMQTSPDEITRQFIRFDRGSFTGAGNGGTMGMVHIFDLSGRLLKNDQVMQSNNLQDAANGIYIVRFRERNGK